MVGVEVGGGINLDGEFTLVIGGGFIILVYFPVIGVSSGDIVDFGMSFCELSVSSYF